MNRNRLFKMVQPPEKWKHLGMVLKRGETGEYDSSVTGDPCIVLDEKRNCWHMFYFAQNYVDGEEVNCNAHAVSHSESNVGPGMWEKLGPIIYTNPEELQGNPHKPWILMDPYRPNIPVKIEGNYWLFIVSLRGKNKTIQAATSQSLDGPWEVRACPVLDIGNEDAFDGYHVDTVTAYWFEERREFLIFYKGYPQKSQQDQVFSPYGSSTAAAVMKPGDRSAKKLGKVLFPENDKGHWTAGWTSGMQIFPSSKGGWYALLTASPTPPDSVEEEPSMREPAPSLGGWAFTQEEWPVRGWVVNDRPIICIEDIPEEAKNAGEETNLWRHHILILPDGKVYLYYNSGRYGNERIFARYAEINI